MQHKRIICIEMLLGFTGQKALKFLQGLLFFGEFPEKKYDKSCEETAIEVAIHFTPTFS